MLCFKCGEEYLTLQEVAELLNIDIETVRKWASDGAINKLPYQKIGNLKVVKQSDLDKFVPSRVSLGK